MISNRERRWTRVRDCVHSRPSRAPCFLGSAAALPPLFRSSRHRSAPHLDDPRPQPLPCLPPPSRGAQRRRSSPRFRHHGTVSTSPRAARASQKVWWGVIPSSARDLLFTIGLHVHSRRKRTKRSPSSGHGFNRAAPRPAHGGAGFPIFHFTFHFSVSSIRQLSRPDPNGRFAVLYFHPIWEFP